MFLKNLDPISFTLDLFRRLEFQYLLAVLMLIIPTLARAEEFAPDCFPTDSAWENIEFQSFNLSDTQQPAVNRDGHSISLTFNQFESYLPRFYAFAMLKNDLSHVPEIKGSTVLENDFHGIDLVALTAEGSNEQSTTYRFTPPKQGTWVIYLLAAIEKIPYLEQQNLRISPNGETVRGGSVFSGSSLNLSEPIDYKACVVQFER